jgi:DNA modification methylase
VDCLEFLETLEASSVDMILVDPPYFGVIKDKWDNQWSDENEYLNWCANWTAHCVRVLKPNDGGVGNTEDRHIPQI